MLAVAGAELVILLLSLAVDALLPAVVQARVPGQEPIVIMQEHATQAVIVAAAVPRKPVVSVRHAHGIPAVVPVHTVVVQILRSILLPLPVQAMAAIGVLSIINVILVQAVARVVEPVEMEYVAEQKRQALVQAIVEVPLVPHIQPKPVVQQHLVVLGRQRIATIVAAAARPVPAKAGSIAAADKPVPEPGERQATPVIVAASAAPAAIPVLQPIIGIVIRKRIAPTLVPRSGAEPTARALLARPVRADRFGIATTPPRVPARMVIGAQALRPAARIIARARAAWITRAAPTIQVIVTAKARVPVQA